jgi:hypothetical protein
LSWLRAWAVGLTEPIIEAVAVDIFLAVVVHVSPILVL